MNIIKPQYLYSIFMNIFIFITGPYSLDLTSVVDSDGEITSRCTVSTQTILLLYIEDFDVLSYPYEFIITLPSYTRLRSVFWFLLLILRVSRSVLCFISVPKMVYFDNNHNLSLHNIHFTY